MTEAAAREFAWTAAADHPAFAGHFPGRPIVPGVVLLDRAILFAEELTGKHASRWRVGNAKFLRPVGPGETLVFALTARANGAIAFSVGSPQGEVASGSPAGSEVSRLP